MATTPELQNLTAGQRKVILALDELTVAVLGTATSVRTSTVHRGAALSLIEAGMVEWVDASEGSVRRRAEAEVAEDVKPSEAAMAAAEADGWEYPEAPSGHDVIDGPLSDADFVTQHGLIGPRGEVRIPPAHVVDEPAAPAYDLAKAQAEVEQLVAWRKVGKHQGEPKPETPNRDAMLAAHAVGSAHYAPPKPQAPAKAPKGDGAKRTPIKVTGRDYTHLGNARIHFTYKGATFEGKLTGDAVGKVDIGDGVPMSLSKAYCTLTNRQAANGHALWLTEDGRPVGEAAQAATAAAEGS